MSLWPRKHRRAVHAAARPAPTTHHQRSPRWAAAASTPGSCYSVRPPAHAWHRRRFQQRCVDGLAEAIAVLELSPHTVGKCPWQRPSHRHVQTPGGPHLLAGASRTNRVAAAAAVLLHARAAASAVRQPAAWGRRREPPTTPATPPPPPSAPTRYRFFPTVPSLLPPPTRRRRRSFHRLCAPTPENPGSGQLRDKLRVQGIRGRAHDRAHWPSPSPRSCVRDLQPADASSTCARNGTAPTFVTLRTAVVSSCPQQLGVITLGQNRL